MKISLLIFSFIITNFIFLTISHPLAMGILLMIQTIITALISGMVLSSFWFSYILILTFLGGMLILFIYVATLAPNEQFSISPFSIIPPLMLFSAIPVMSAIPPTKTTLTLTVNHNLTPSALWMFSACSTPLSIFLIIYLLLVLLAVVKITNFWMGSLRSLK